MRGHQVGEARETAQDVERTLRRLRVVQWAALVDLALLSALIFAAVTGRREVVHILGPLHGVNFLLLLTLVGTAALDGLWGWWFPLVTLVTAGPPGALIGEVIIRRGLARRGERVRAMLVDELRGEEGEV